MAGEPILVVDDNATNLKLTKIVLANEGYRVETAMNAEEATHKMKNEGFKPRLILMDIQLPGMDGLTFTRQLKSAPETKGIVVVALTAYAMKADEEKALAAGCDGFIAKPIDTQAFPSQIAGYLKR